MPVGETFRKYREGCEYISGVAWESKTWGKVKLHHATYYKTRERTGLPSQLTCTARDKVAEAYKRDKSRRHRFKPDSVRLDARTFGLKDERLLRSLPRAGGSRHRSLLATTKGNSFPLGRRRGQQTSFARGTRSTCTSSSTRTPTLPKLPPTISGLTFGIRNIASTSDGEILTGEVVDKVRTRYAKFRQKLQSKGTRSAKRKLKRLSGREGRFQRDVNHVVSKTLVREASRVRQGSCRRRPRASASGPRFASLRGRGIARRGFRRTQGLPDLQGEHSRSRAGRY